MRTRLLSVVFALLASSLAAEARGERGPSAESAPSFDVTSVKPSKAGGARGGVIQPGRFAQTSVTLRQLISLAYGSGEIVGGPRWLDSDHFDVEGRGAFGLADFLPSSDGSPARVYRMLQRLLEERFQLALRKQTQERPVYALLFARRDQRLGERLQRSATDCDALTAATLRGGRPPDRPQPGQPPPCSMRVAPGHLVGDAVDMPRLANVLSSSTGDRVVVDRTGLMGRFNVDLEWTPDTLVAPSDLREAIVPPAPDAPPSLFIALQEQLGLKLEPTNAPIEVLVVDRAEQPTPN